MICDRGLHKLKKVGKLDEKKVLRHVMCKVPVSSYGLAFYSIVYLLNKRWYMEQLTMHRYVYFIPDLKLLSTFMADWRRKIYSPKLFPMYVCAHLLCNFKIVRHMTACFTVLPSFHYFTREWQQE